MSVLCPTPTSLTFSRTTNAMLVGSSLTQSNSPYKVSHCTGVYLWLFLICREARIEFGDDIAKALKLSEDGAVVLWPQPTDDPEDPQNVRPA